MYTFYNEVIINTPKPILSSQLEKIGIVHDTSLYPLCYIIEKKNRYYIVHYKELFSYFSFMNSGFIEKNKIKMIEIDFLKRNYVFNYLLNNNYIQSLTPSRFDIYDNSNIIIDTKKQYTIVHKIQMVI
jgi:hypothetical protein